jgi:hypothetical protein
MFLNDCPIGCHIADIVGGDELSAAKQSHSAKRRQRKRQKFEGVCSTQWVLIYFLGS